MKTQLRILLTLGVLGMASTADAGVDWVLEEGDAYSRVICRAASDTTARREEIHVMADEKGRGPALSCKLENFEIVVENDLFTEKKIKRQNLIWAPPEDGIKRRRYFVLPEVCWEENDTIRCRKQVHVKDDVFQIDLPGTCPYKVFVGALPIITTATTNKTKAPLQPSGTMLLPNGDVTSNPFAWHPDYDVDGAYYRDHAIVWVTCPPEPLVRSTCGNGMIDDGEICDDGNRRDDDFCSNRCTPPSVNPICGDGNIDPGEQCDDGNQNDDDGCSNDCELPPIVPPSCGDGVLQPGDGETCEIGQTVAPVGGGSADRACRDSCSYCGDGIVDQGEECDDGNGDDGDACSNSCVVPPAAYRYCAMFRDPSFSRDFEGNVRLKANGRMEAIDTSVADPSDDLVVDIGTERIIVKASTVEEGVVFEREFLPGSLAYYERSGNRGWEHDASNVDFMKLKMNRDYTRFNLELPGDAPMGALLDKVEAGQVDGRMVTFQIRFEDERIICQAETWWDCKDTGERSHCKGPLQ